MRELGAICLIEGKPAGGFRILFIPVRKGRYIYSGTRCRLRHRLEQAECLSENFFFLFVCFACSGFMCRLDIHSGQSEKSLASVPTCTAARLGRPQLSIKCVCYQQR